MEAYITEATFKQIISEVQLPSDFKFNDTLIWELTKGGEISYDNPVIFSKYEVEELLKYKVFCREPSLLNTVVVYKKIVVHDSLKYIDPERPPHFHYDKDCKALHSNYDYTPVKIPEILLSRYADENEKRTKVNEYRDYYNRLTSEFNVKYGEKWIDDNNHKRQFAARIAMKFNIPDTHVFDRDEIGAKNSGVHIDDGMEIKYIQDEITASIKRLWDDDERKKLWRSNRSLFCQSQLNDGEINNAEFSYYSPEEINHILSDINSIKKKIKGQLKHLYRVQYCPELKFDEELLRKLGLYPCYTCSRYSHGKDVSYLFQ